MKWVRDGRIQVEGVQHQDTDGVGREHAMLGTDYGDSSVAFALMYAPCLGGLCGSDKDLYLDEQEGSLEEMPTANNFIYFVQENSTS